jgi:hypothetical protein
VAAPFASALFGVAAPLASGLSATSDVLSGIDHDAQYGICGVSRATRGLDPMINEVNP